MFHYRPVCVARISAPTLSKYVKQWEGFVVSIAVLVC